MSDAAAYIRVLAAEKGRNAAWAEKAVRESVSLTAEEALRQNVVEFVARDREELFRKLEGKALVKHGTRGRLRLAGAQVRDFPMAPLRRILQVIANPNLALLFLMLGIYGLLYEFSSPGVGFGAVVGLTSLILAGYSLSILPVNYAGLLLIALGIALLVLELQVPSYSRVEKGARVKVVEVAGSTLRVEESKEKPHG